MALRVWLPLNGNLENKGISDLKLVSGSPSYKTGKISSQALNLNNRITFDCAELANLQTLSVCFWGMAENSSTLTSNWQDLLGFSDVSSSGTGGTFRWETTYASTNGIHWHDNATNAFVNGSHTHIAQKGIWCHCCVVFDYEKGKIFTYTNGELVNTHNHLGGKFNSTGRFYLGETNNIEGRINDVRFYDHALSALEVKEISQGLVLHYKLDGFSGGVGENILPNTTSEIRSYEYPSSSFKDQFAVITTKIPEAEKYTLSFYAKSTVAGDKIRAHYYSPNTTTTCVSSQGITKTASDGNIDFTLSTDWQLYWVTYTQTSTTAVKHVILPRMGAVGNTNGVVSGTGIVSIKCVKMEEGEQVTSWTPALSEMGTDTSKITDSSGYGNNGIITGNVITKENDSKEGRYNISTYIPLGSTDYIITQNPIGNPSDAITMNIWFKSNNTTPGNDYHEIFNHATSSQYFEFAIHKTGYFRQGMVINGTRYVANGGNGLLDGNWHMLTATYDGAWIKSYIDGINIVSMTQTVNGTLNGANGKFMFGHYGPNTGYHTKEAYLADARIYATALSAEDIADLYHTPANIDNLQNMHTFEFRENSEKTSIYQNGITSTTNEIHESNAELLNTMSIGGYTPAKNITNSCTNFGYANFDNYASLGKDLAVHIECDVEWTAFTADTGGTFKGVWFQGANYEKASNSFKWAGTNYICSALNSAFSLQTISAITTAGKHRYDITATIPASWFATYSRSNLGWRCDYSDGTGHIDIKNLKITPLQYYNAKIGEDFISANNFIEK